MILHLKGNLIRAIVNHFGDDTKRIEHAVRVMEHAEALLAETPEADEETVLAAAATHDFGITEAEKKHQSAAARYQQQYGPALAQPALEKIGMPADKIENICAIIARHHSPPERPSLEFRLLYESDCLVNLRDNAAGDATVSESAVSRHFSTPAGIKRARRLLLGEQTLFERMGSVYKLLVNEKKREKKESALLLEVAGKTQVRDDTKRSRPQTAILDLACGTGFHARFFAEKGYRVIAIDRSEGMLEEARKRSSATPIDYRKGDLLKAFPEFPPAALTLLLGNTLSTFPSLDEIRHVFRNASDATEPGGFLICQTLNYERFKQNKSGQTVTHHNTVEGRETVLTKVLQPLENGTVLITMTCSQQSSDRSWETSCRSSILLSLKPEDLISCGEKAGLVHRRLSGDMTGAPFSQDTSTDCVLLFQKRN